jgi:hypothetical protein
MRPGVAVEEELLQQLDTGLRCDEAIEHRFGLMSNKITRLFGFCNGEEDFFGFKFSGLRAQSSGRRVEGTSVEIKKLYLSIK